MGDRLGTAGVVGFFSSQIYFNSNTDFEAARLSPCWKHAMLDWRPKHLNNQSLTYAHTQNFFPRILTMCCKVHPWRRLSCSEQSVASVVGLAAEDQALRLRIIFTLTHPQSAAAGSQDQKARNSRGYGQPNAMYIITGKKPRTFSRRQLDEREYLHSTCRHVCARNWDRVHPIP